MDISKKITTMLFIIPKELLAIIAKWAIIKGEYIPGYFNIDLQVIKTAIDNAVDKIPEERKTFGAAEFENTSLFFEWLTGILAIPEFRNWSNIPQMHLGELIMHVVEECERDHNRTMEQIKH